MKKKITVIILIIVFVSIVSGIWYFRFLSKGVNIQKFIPENNIVLYSEYYKPYSRILFLIENDPLFANFSRENLKKNLPSKVYDKINAYIVKNKDLIKNFFNDKVILAAYVFSKNEVGILMGIEGPSKLRYRAIFDSFFRSKSIIESYKGISFYKYNIEGKKKNTDIYLFRYKNCYFLSNKKRCILNVINIAEKKDENNIYRFILSDKKLHKSFSTERNNILSRGIKFLKKSNSFYEIYYENKKILYCEHEKIHLKSFSNNMNKLLPYWNPSLSFSSVLSLIDMQAINETLKEASNLQTKYQMEEIKENPFYKFMSKYWDRGIILNMDFNLKNIYLDFSILYKKNFSSSEIVKYFYENVLKPQKNFCDVKYDEINNKVSFKIGEKLIKIYAYTNEDDALFSLSTSVMKKLNPEKRKKELSKLDDIFVRYFGERGYNRCGIVKLNIAQIYKLSSQYLSSLMMLIPNEESKKSFNFILNVLGDLDAIYAELYIKETKNDYNIASLYVLKTK